MNRWAAWFVALTICVVSGLSAQQPAVPAAAVHDSVVRDSVARAKAHRDSIAALALRVRRDSADTDTTRRDSSATRDLVTWIPSDSIATELLKRSGFRPIRYQGDSVNFNATNKALRIIGVPAAVSRESALIVGDTVIYDDSTRIVVALGDTVTVRDPGQQQSDIVSRGRVAYNLSQRRALVTDVSTVVEAGNRYFVKGKTAAFVGDTTRGRHGAFYIRSGTITTCDDSIPDYYFRSNEIKFVTHNLIVARPAVLYISGVPVMWLPFIFQDTRTGRRSGILTPRVGLSDFVRNSPSYRRTVENLGYYANMGNFMDALAWADWRSGARSTEADPGYTRLNGEFRYNWLDRFLSGSLAANYLKQRDGATSTTVSFYHDQSFSQTSRLNARINYTTNTVVQRAAALNPYAALATIRSDVRYSRQVGPFALDVGGSRTQYPGRTQVEENYPTLSLSSPTLAVTHWLDWTPSFNYTRTATRKSDQVGLFTYNYFTNAAGVIDSTRVLGSSDNTSFGLNTPIAIKGYQINFGINGSHQGIDSPQPLILIDPTDASRSITRTYASTFVDGIDWNVGFALPSFFNSSLRVRPDVSLENVAGGSYWVRSQLSGGEWVHQDKRVSTGLSISPTLFGLFPGFGPFSRIRHSITPSIRYSYAPKGDVPVKYLQALNQSPFNYLGALAQNQVSLSLSQVFEAKLRSDTAASGEGRKVKLLALDFTPFVYDFERARATGRTGLTTTEFSYTATTDLLPGFTFRSDYSLFQGDINTDSARFKPFRESIGASFSINGQTGVVAALARLFGHTPAANTSTSVDTVPAVDPNRQQQQQAALPIAGNRASNSRYEIPDTKGWSTSLTYSSRRQRPPIGGTVLSYDPTSFCNTYAADTAFFNRCVTEAQINPTTASPITNPLSGGVFVRVPPTQTIQSNTSFHITPMWSAQWQTTYDFVHNAFASQQINLQRELHDWRAIFSYSSSPNGNSYFSVSIANKAIPELNFPYHRSTYRQQQ